MVAYHLELNKGDLLDGKYIVVKKIGSGSYGDVFLVDHRGSTYALKLLRLWEVPNDVREQLISKFEREYQAGKIDSEYLIHTSGFGLIKGNPYLLMEYCPKGDLSQLIKGDKSQLPLYARDILEGLQKLHAEGKIHRDLKPENVLIKSNGKAALTDFGIVGEMDKSKRKSGKDWLGHPKQVQGTPLYMAPEMYDRQAGGVTYLPTVDIWSFGVMMYEILTGGSFPFGDIQTMEELDDYLRRAKNNAWNVNRLRDIPHGREWETVIGGCLHPDYRKRYQSAQDVWLDLKPIIGSVSSSIIEQHEYRSTNISRLIVTQGDNMGECYELNTILRTGRMLRVGRKPKEEGNDIVLPESNSSYISRYHFTLERAKDGSFWIIRDGQWQKKIQQWVTSTNGTYINATPVNQEGMKIFTGDIITVGDFKLKVE